jgi:predicted RNA polymerase sigma factor
MAMSADLQRSIDAVWRAESPRIIAALMRLVRDLDLAEELAQDALVTALERWPASGLPDNPGAWLMAAAKNRALDQLRRGRMLARKHAQIAQELDGLHDELHAAREACSSISASRPSTSASPGSRPASRWPRRSASAHSAGRMRSSPAVAA